MHLQTCLLDEFHLFVCCARDLLFVTMSDILLCVISFRVVLGPSFVYLYGNKAFVFSLLQAAGKARERNPGKNHRYIFNRFYIPVGVYLLLRLTKKNLEFSHSFLLGKIEYEVCLASLMVSVCSAAGLSEREANLHVPEYNYLH